MKGFYEKSSDDTSFITTRKRVYEYPTHYHQSIEILILSEGSYSINLNGKTLKLVAGDVLAINSFEVHTYLAPISEIKGRVIRIPRHILSLFEPIKNNRSFKTNLIHDSELSKELINIADKFLYDYPDIDVQYSAARFLFSRLAERLSYSENTDNSDTELICQILSYINENFKDKISLPLLGKHFGYHPDYISKIFKKYCLTGIPNYVNECRLIYLESQLQLGKKNLKELIFESGFGSIQTYYRFKSSKNKT